MVQCKARIGIAGALASSSANLGNVTAGLLGLEGNDHGTLREEVYKQNYG